jgi:hypothetical protein
MRRISSTSFVTRGRSFLLPQPARVADPLPTRYERIDETAAARTIVARRRLFEAGMLADDIPYRGE